MGARQVLGTEPIGLQLLLATVRSDVARRCCLRRFTHDLAHATSTLALQNRAQYRRSQHAQPGVLLARGALRTMACRDVADLVADHAGQVGLTLHVRHDAARHVHIPARQRKGVDLRAVEHGEVPLQLAAMRQAGQALAQCVDIRLHRRVVDHRVFLQDFPVLLDSQRHLGGLAQHTAFLLPGDRIANG